MCVLWRPGEADCVSRPRIEAPAVALDERRSADTGLDERVGAQILDRDHLGRYAIVRLDLYCLRPHAAAERRGIAG
jgi:hypothetical protein